MLKIIILSCLVVAAYSISNEYKSKAMEKLTEYAGICIDEVGANDDDISELMAKKIPSRKEGKCLIACISKKLGFMTADGKPNKAGALKTFESLKADDADTYTKFMAISDKCDAEIQKLAETDECEIAVKAAECVKKACEEQGLDATSIMG